MSVLSNKGILRAMAEDRVRITDFDPKRLNTASYDVRLGEWIYRFEPPFPNGPVDTSDAFGVQDVKELRKLMGILTLRPHERVLAHTIEFVGGRHNIVAEMRARSSSARWGFTVCACAGWGDVGFTGRWTMEIFNTNPFPININVGARVAQIVFHEVDQPINDATSYEKTGHYAAEWEWSPSDMLPKPLK
jgi:dCTP deaminase